MAKSYNLKSEDLGLTGKEKSAPRNRRHHHLLQDAAELMVSSANEAQRQGVPLQEAAKATSLKKQEQKATPKA